jgi:autotransporter-associated beta strand protein
LNRKTLFFDAGSRDSGLTFKYARQCHANLPADGAAERPGVSGVLGLTLEFRPRSGVQKRVQRCVRVLGMLVLVFAAWIVSVPPAMAQSLWQGVTPTYETNTNWLPPTTPPSPPIGPGQLAVFDAGPASTTINVTSSSIAPGSWTFNAGAQSYTISGGAVNFSLAGPLGGIIDNANVGQTISIANNIGELAAGVQVLQQGSSTLILAGTNTYSGGTTISSGGVLQVTNNSSVGSGAVTLDSGGFQADGFSDLTFTNRFKINAGGGTIDANGIALTISGNITDGNAPGALTAEDSSFGSGRVILTGTNTYTGGTTICVCGTLQLGTLAASSTAVPAAMRSSSPTAPAMSISPAVSVRMAMAASPRARSRVRASITSADSIR